MFCEHCGAKLMEGSRFCVNCGAKNPMMETPQTPEQTIPEQEVPAQEAPVQEVPVQEAPVQEVPLQETPVQETPVVPTSVPPTPTQSIPVQTMPVQPAPTMGQVPQGQMPQGQMPQKSKKILPIWVNVLLGLLAIAVIAGFVMLVITEKRGNDSNGASNTASSKKTESIKENPKENQEETSVFELSGETFEVTIPETEASIQGEEFASSYIIPDSDSVLLDYDTLIQNYTAGDLWFAYYEIFARYGVIFDDEDLNAFFSAKTWYVPSIYEADLEEYDMELNEFESQNLTTIESAYDELYY